jgi:hypothetical protein
LGAAAAVAAVAEEAPWLEYTVGGGVEATNNAAHELQYHQSNIRRLLQAHLWVQSWMLLAIV